MSGNGKGDLVTQRWGPRHELVVMLHVTGHRNNEIAEKLGYDPAYVSRIINDPRAQALIPDLQRRVAENTVDVATKLELLASEAVDTAAHWMRKRDQKFAAVSARSAFGILDRAGYSKVERKIIGHVDLSEDRLDRMAEQAERANRAAEDYDYSVEDARESVDEADDV